VFGFKTLYALESYLYISDVLGIKGTAVQVTFQLRQLPYWLTQPGVSNTRSLSLQDTRSPLKTVTLCAARDDLGYEIYQ